MQTRGQSTAVTGLPCNNVYCVVARIVDGQKLRMTFSEDPDVTLTR